MQTLKQTILGEKAMLQLGVTLAKQCKAPLLIFLQGHLGAGKTTLVRGFLRGLGYQERVKSPSYTLIECYEINTHQIYHCDLYRLENPEEIQYLGFDDIFIAQVICFIEWPENAGNLLPAPDLSCHIQLVENGRELLWTAHNLASAAILQSLSA